MKIYTKTGDDGSTGLYGGKRLSKDALRLWAYGTVDEANAVLGLAATQLEGELREIVTTLQNRLFDLGADLATPHDSAASNRVRRMSTSDVAELEAFIDRLDARLSPLAQFILPGGTPAAASLHLARTVVRRAERGVVSLHAEETVNEQALIYLNRLSDLLFVLARMVNAEAGVSDVNWQKRPEAE